MLKLYNTLTRKKETFKPIKPGNASFYSCGPTVYNYAHIGNLRTYLFNDVLKRSLIFLGYKVKHVMNITDVDDKTIKGTIKESMPLKQFTEKYTKIFFEDLNELNIIKPDFVLKATESIPEMVHIVKTLLDKGYAYKTDDGIYFSINKFKNYGKLAQLDKIKSTKARIKADEYTKENPRDFALWKFHTDEDGPVFWENEIGKGRPGWHIECSAMSTKILGNHFDIHTGAIDLIFPHHTNEIAQSECAFNEKFVNYWLHAGFLTFKEGKMSKSIGDVFYLKDLKEKGFSPIDYRYFCLSTHYRSPLLFTFENLESAKNTNRRLKNIASDLKDDGKTNEKYLKEFKKAIENDLDMPNALQVLWKLLRDEKAQGKLQTIREMNKVLGLKLFDKEKIELPKEIQELVKEREKSRKNKDWKKADEIRNEIKSLGYSIEDSSEGTKIQKS